MEYVGIQSIKESYSDAMLQMDRVDEAIDLKQKDFATPVFNELSVHPEDEPSIDRINYALADISIDLLALDKEFSAAASLYNSLINSVKTRLDAVDEQLLAEEERIKDMNIICGNYKEFSSVKTLATTDFEGYFSSEGEYTFSTQKLNVNEISPQILQVTGNGYEGNQYVRNTESFEKDSMDTSTRIYMTDQNLVTAYEYSRLTMSEKEKQYPQDANLDSEEAQCGIILFASEAFNTMKLSSDIDTVMIEDILTSGDEGLTFASVLPKAVAMNNMDAKYESGEYAFGSGVLCFPETQYVKLLLKSQGATSDKLAFKSIDTTDAEKPVEKIMTLENTKRHVIRINNISVRSGTYAGAAKMDTGELIKTPVNSIAVFANEYIPPYYSKDSTYIEYVLNVNGVDHKIVPINSDANGTKVIRHAEYSAADDYVVHLNESIKSAKLTVNLYSLDGKSTPYLSNVKICLGKAESK